MELTDKPESLNVEVSGENVEPDRFYLSISVDTLKFDWGLLISNGEQEAAQSFDTGETVVEFPEVQDTVSLPGEFEIAFVKGGHKPCAHSDCDVVSGEVVDAVTVKVSEL